MYGVYVEFMYVICIVFGSCLCMVFVCENIKGVETGGGFQGNMRVGKKAPSFTQ